MYNVAIIGCGSIGALKPDDKDYLDITSPLTHAHAFAINPKVQNIYFMDTDQSKAEQAAAKWCGIPVKHFSDLYFKIDVVVVAVPTQEHRQTLLRVLDLSPKVVIAEKPFCSNTIEAKHVIEEYEKAETPLLVNYMRQYIPKISLFMGVLKKKHIYWVNVKYTRGFVREACHAINLCNSFLGEFKQGLTLDTRKTLHDYAEEDPTYYAVLDYEKSLVYFSPSSGNDYNIFEMEVCTDEGVYELLNNGDTISKRGLEESIYGNYKTINMQRQYTSTDLHNGLSCVSNAVIDLVEGKEVKHCCYAKEALAVHQVYDRVFE
jgi:predicted dehydrogenase